jgi:hypothetical protein
MNIIVRRIAAGLSCTIVVAAACGENSTAPETKAMISRVDSVTRLASTSAAARSPLTQSVVATCLGSETDPDPKKCVLFDSRQAVGDSVRLTSNLGSLSTGATLSAIGNAQSTFGILHAAITSTFNVVGPHAIQASAIAYGEFRDILTISFAPSCGRPGLLGVGYTLHGTSSSFGLGVGYGATQIAVYDPAATQVDHSNQWGSVYTGPTLGMFFVPITFHFIYCQPFALDVFLETHAGTNVPDVGSNGNYVGWDPGLALGLGTANAGFGNTLILSQLNALDVDGNPVPDAVFSSASGTFYSRDGVVLPASIEIRPESDQDHVSINSRAAGSLRVAIESNAHLDVSSIDQKTLRFGRAGTEQSLASCEGTAENAGAPERNALICRFNVQAAGFQSGDTLARLSGFTSQGIPFAAQVSVEVRGD